MAAYVLSDETYGIQAECVHMCYTIHGMSLVYSEFCRNNKQMYSEHQYIISGNLRCMLCSLSPLSLLTTMQSLLQMVSELRVYHTPKIFIVPLTQYHYDICIMMSH